MNATDLERRLSAPPAETLGHPDLAAIRALGTRRRRTRLASIAAGTTLALAAVGGVGVGLADRPGPDSLRERQTTVYTPPTAPEELSPLAQRVLDEVDGAVRVSAGQVVVPAPEGRSLTNLPVAAQDIARGPVALGTHTYAGVTSYAAKQFPAWLHDGVAEIEQTDLAGDDGSYPVGSTEMGILVESGEAELVCLSASSSRGEDQPGEGCYPALVSAQDSTQGDQRQLQWSMGTESFLEPGAEMELFTSEDYSDGSPSTLWIGGLDGTDVDHVELALADGSTVEATVLSGSLVPGDTMFFADVASEPTTVTAYDASGAVIDDHDITSCSGGIDCEVR